MISHAPEPAEAPDGRAALFDDVLRALSLALDFDEGQKLFHAWRTALLARALGEHLGVADKDELFHAGLLHDIGGMGLTDHVLHSARTGFRDPQSRTHAAEGARILRPFSLLAPLAPLIADHHERFDGRGFPQGKSGDAVPQGAYILHAADLLEVGLRGEPPDARWEVTRRLVRDERGAAWPATVADAALALLEGSPGFVADLYDDRRLEERVRAVRFAPKDLGRLSKVEILSQLLWVFARVIDAKHPYTFGHSFRVARLARGIARALGASAVNDWDLAWAGLLHDVGMIGVPRPILEEARTLTEAELASVRRHTLDTLAIVSSIGELEPLAWPAAAHHEWWDGSGYPRGAAGEAIPLLSRILAYADTYDALRSDRAHRRGMPHERAMERIRELVGHQFDPHLADLALPVLDELGRVPPMLDEDRAYRRLFERDDADVRAVLSAAPSVIARGPRGALLVEVEPWETVEIRPPGELLNGREALAALAGGDPGGDLPAFLDADSRGRLLDWAAAPGQTPRLSTYLFAPDGSPFEALALRRADRIELHLRSAKARLLPMRQLAAFYRNFLAAGEAAFFTDPDGRILDVNRTFLELFGYSFAELAHALPPIFRAPGGPDGGYEQLLSTISRQKDAWTDEVLASTRDGRALPTLFTLVAVRDAAGVLIGFIGRVVDLSARKRLEGELARKNQQLEALSRLKSDLVAITSHDLKSPLAGMMSYAGLVKAHLAEGRLAKVPVYVDQMVKLGDNMLRLIHDILSLQKIEAGAYHLERAPGQLAQVLQRSAEAQAAVALEREVELRLSAPEDLPPLLLDVDRMEQVFNNLLSNALRFAPAGSAVDLTCERRGGAICGSVSDRGPGIPEAELLPIFDRYHQVHKQAGVSKRAYNVGLGLTIARSIVELHGGRIWAENRAGGGCSFRVELPAPAPRPRGAALSALVLEEAGLVRLHLEPMLAARGARVLTAADLPTAKRLSAAEPPDIVFAHSPSLSPEVTTWVEGLVGPEGRRPALVEVHECETAGVGGADRRLTLPVLEIELLELLREIRGAPSA